MPRFPGPSPAPLLRPGYFAMAGQSVDATVVAIRFRILATGGSHQLDAWRRANSRSLAAIAGRGLR
jgi:hypothetical protein